MFYTELKTGSNQTLHTEINDNFLSVLSSLFIDSIAIDHSKENQTKILSRQHFRRGADAWPHKGPREPQTPCHALEIKEYFDRKAEPDNADRKTLVDNGAKTIRTFILGLSDTFNDLLMGIWGNLSLINLSIEKNGLLHKRISDMESLIQNGSAFINGIFGYLGERRVVAKSIRLTQLLQDFNEYMPIDRRRLNQEMIKQERHYPAAVTCPATIATSLANTIEQFVAQIQKHHDLIKPLAIKAKGLRCRLQTIDRQMLKAWEMIYLLKLYSGMVVPKLKKISLRPLIQDEVRKIRKKDSQMPIVLDMAERLPGINADRTMLKFVFKQVLQNALQAMPGQGILRVDIRTLSSETPKNRCVAYRWGDSVVVTISDTGFGMDLDTLLHIFDPFFAGNQPNNHRLGMGLSAAWGIIKLHGGYIHVRSESGSGSTFKIYLPIH